uniref:La-related protein 7 n=1 Tax=Culicoides sonorensis TaxID=179676 RepID=A0A336LYV2_CULSO
MEKSEKKYRQRNKQRRNAIRQQMEFYFSDSNLTKDRYLSQLVKNSTDSYVEISEFLKFNKIKSLTESIEDIAKAVTGSELIQLSEDQTKVKRKTDLQVKADADECTLYVESLPKHATHDYVKEIFSRFGTVTYVSLPKYKHSRKIKEFGFVEYENQESVIKAIEAFKQWNGVLVYQDADPNKLQSVVSFNEEQKIEKRNKDKGECEDQGQKRENDEDTEPPNKKMRTESECTENQENESMLNEMTESSAKEDEPEENKSELKTTSESKTSQKKKKTKTVTPITEEKVFDMKIMPKREWKRLRNKYLNLQRERFKEIKQKLQAGRKQQEKKQEKKKPAPTPSKATIKTSSPRKINFYGALPFDKKSGSDENTDDQEVPSRLKKPLFSFEPGLIVNIKFQEPLVDVKEFKQELKNLYFIKYIDVKEGDPEAFVRVDKFASANQLVKFYANSDYQTQILSGEIEQLYWQKMIKDREQKLNKNIKPNKMRGREKLSKKIAQHIRFDE